MTCLNSLPISCGVIIVYVLCIVHLSSSQSAPRHPASADSNDDVVTRVQVFNASAGYALSPQHQSVHHPRQIEPALAMLSDGPNEPLTGSDSTHAPGCAHCGSASERTAKRSYRIESIKVDILRKLHLRSPPNITGRALPALPHIQRLVEQLSGSGYQSDAPVNSQPVALEPFDADDVTYNSNVTHGVFESWEDSDEDRATTMKIIQISKPVPPERRTSGHDASRFCYFPFPMSEIRSPSQIVDVLIGIYVRIAPVQHDPSTGSPERYTHILIYMMRAGGERYLVRRRRIALTPTDTGKWYHFVLKKKKVPTATLR